MKTALCLSAPLMLFALSCQADPGNPEIDARQHLRITTQALTYREDRRVDETEFLRLARQQGAVILDARSADKYAQLHVQGAVSLPFTDMTVESLAAALPDKDALVLIYCNNNFSDARQAFPTKRASASLNLSTYAALYDYGYRNVYELAPLLETTSLPMEGTLAAR
jgi:3-mercaptopyruvate sulfurtransferase SseA